MRTDASGMLQQLRCEVCGASVATLRRGRCWGCYERWQKLQPVGVGAHCVICTERRRENLQRVELFGKWQTMCHICAVRALRLNPMPPSLEGIRARLRRERRYGDRRLGRKDTRLLEVERRVGERRAVLLSESDILWMHDLPEIEIQEINPLDPSEITGLFERVTL